ncbi:hypothetical protein Mal15_29630 [Stieleria maiorica]|uniref:Uncharacterized protein n=1 Tax=Stieleria maiorica TaxID=2795974 RepID=A0A5B9MH65_9BACT|nr:hypothetical protein [Stieleria maiorica]QEF98905.1 hypothetical protein Mal15_29630 [Stieleria maiorica]
MQLTSPSTLEYFRDGHVISLDDDAFGLLGSYASARKRVATSDPDHGYNVEQIRESLLRGQVVVRSGGIELDDRVANAGMIELLDYLANKCEINLQGRCHTRIAVLPDPSALDRLSYRALPRFLSDHPRGLIRMPRSCSPAEVVADVRAAFPSSRILILGRVQALRQIQAEIPKLLSLRMTSSVEQIALVSDGEQFSPPDDEDFPKLLLSTPIASADLDSEKCDIVLLLDALHCTHATMQNVLVQVDARFRLFGFVDANRELKPYEQARLHQVFGFSQIDLMSRERVRRPVHYAIVRQGGDAPRSAVLMKPTVPGRRPAASVNSLAAYTHHHARNATICRLAKALRFGSPLNNSRFRDIRRWLDDRCRDQLNVTIAVDRLDHAIQLGKRLPDWPIIAENNNNLHDISPQIRRRIKTDSKRWLPGDQQIVVAEEAKSFGGNHSDVVIWASGGTSVAAIPASWMFSQSDPDRPMLIVDFLDKFAPAARQWSMRRFRHLEARDVFRVGTPTPIGRIERFLRDEGGSQ